MNRLGVQPLRRGSILLVTLILAGGVVYRASADGTSPKPEALSKEKIQFFETYIRPVLAEHCYQCHSTQARKLKGKLLLDSRSAIAKGGANGPVLVAGDADKSRLIQALRWTDPDFVMPPNKKLTPRQIEKFEQWVKMESPDRAASRRQDWREWRKLSTSTPLASGGRFGH